MTKSANGGAISVNHDENGDAQSDEDAIESAIEKARSASIDELPAEEVRRRLQALGYSPERMASLLERIQEKVRSRVHEAPGGRSTGKQAKV